LVIHIGKGESDRGVRLDRQPGRKPVGLLQAVPCRGGLVGICVGQAFDPVNQDPLALGVGGGEVLAVQDLLGILVHCEPAIEPCLVVRRKQPPQTPREPKVPGVHGEIDAPPDEVHGQLAGPTPGLEYRVARGGPGPAAEPQALYLGEGFPTAPERDQPLEVVAATLDRAVGTIKPDVLRPPAFFCQLGEPEPTEAGSKRRVAVGPQEMANVALVGLGEVLRDCFESQIGVERILLQPLGQVLEASAVSLRQGLLGGEKPFPLARRVCLGSQHEPERD